MIDSEMVFKLVKVGLFLYVGFFVYSILQEQSRRGHCEGECAENGYVDFRYVPQSTGRHTKVTTPEQCYCLTQEEVEVTDRIPLGTKIY